MTVPTIVFLLVGGVLSDRHDRRLPDARGQTSCARRRSPASPCSSSPVRFSCGSSSRSSPCTAPALRSSRRRSRRSSPTCFRRHDLAAANSLDQFVRPIALRLAGPLLGGWLVAAGAGLAFAVDAASFARLGDRGARDAPAADAESAEYVSHGARGARGALVHPPARLALGDARRRGGGLPRLPRSERGAAPVRRQERAARIGGHARARLRGRRCSERRCGGLDGPARPSAARRHASCTRPGRWRRWRSPATGSQPRPGS